MQTSVQHEGLLYPPEIVARGVESEIRDIMHMYVSYMGGSVHENNLTFALGEANKFTTITRTITRGRSHFARAISLQKLESKQRIITSGSLKHRLDCWSTLTTHRLFYSRTLLKFRNTRLHAAFSFQTSNISTR